MDVIKTRPDKARARALLELAKERLEDVGSYKPYKKVEEYWDIAKELILAIMHARGYNSLSHKALVEWLSSNYADFTDFEIRVLDMLRKARNDITYYGKKQKEKMIYEFEGVIKKIIEKLVSIAEGAIKDSY